jgi:hypothetical protein
MIILVKKKYLAWRSTFLATTASDFYYLRHWMELLIDHDTISNKTSSNKKSLPGVGHLDDYLRQFYYSPVRKELFIDSIDTISNKSYFD